MIKKIYYTLIIFVLLGCQKNQNPESGSQNTTSANNVFIVGTAQPLTGYIGGGGFIWGKSTSAVPMNLNSNIKILSAKSVFSNNSATYVVGAADTVLAGGLVSKTARPYLYNYTTGEITLLAESGIAIEVFASGVDVYILGHKQGVLGYADQVWGYWKNKVWIPLPLDFTPKSIYVYNNDVYFCGDVIMGGYHYPAICKNGIVTTLSSLEGIAESIFVNGTGVYVVGNIDRGDALNFKGAYLWKDGVQSRMSTSIERAAVAAYYVKVSGNDIYVAGYNYSHQSIWGYWKNNEWHKVSSIDNLFAFAVNDTNVYLGGIVIENNNSYSGYTKNGLVTKLTYPSGVSNVLVSSISFTK